MSDVADLAKQCADQLTGMDKIIPEKPKSIEKTIQNFYVPASEVSIRYEQPSFTFIDCVAAFGLTTGFILIGFSIFGMIIK